MDKRPLILCTDPGIDDFVALSMVLAKPQFDVLGMIALSGNVGLDVTVNNALLACEYNDRPDVPVLAGSAKPLARPARTASNIHGKSGLGQSLELYAEAATPRPRSPLKFPPPPFPCSSPAKHSRIRSANNIRSGKLRSFPDFYRE